MEELPVHLTQHAEDVLDERQIPSEWVVRAVRNPSLVCPDEEDAELLHALAAVPEREGRVLRVVYNQGADGLRIVTAFLDRSMRGKL
jgi:hypothetical protein